MSATVVNSDNIVSQSEDKWKGIANNDKTREKYEKVIEITERFFEPQKSAKQKKSDGQIDTQGSIIMIEKFRFHCKLCRKSFLSTIGTTGAIRSHLKVSFYIYALYNLLKTLFLENPFY